MDVVQLPCPRIDEIQLRRPRSLEYLSREIASPHADLGANPIFAKVTYDFLSNLC
jgi:hypothetical protein